MALLLSNDTPPSIASLMPINAVMSSEQQLASCYQEVIVPFWQRHVSHGEFPGVDGISIAYAYAVHPEAIGSIVISSGRIEAFIKYKEVLYDLYQNGYSVFIHDHRGQGLSGRMCANPHLGFVLSFDDYVADFKTFMEKVVKPLSKQQPKLLCHSMGGTIGALYCLAYPRDFQQVVFTAPMFGIRPALPGWLAGVLFAANRFINNMSDKKDDYFFGQADYKNKPFIGNTLTHSEKRYKIFRQEYEACPQAKLGGPTAQWLKAAAEAMDKIEGLAQQFPIPALVIQAGADEVVDNRRQNRVSARLAKGKTMVIARAKHELLMEQDQYRGKCIHATLGFYSGI
jgi:lysophospholipase